MIDMSKQYRTRDGREVQIYDVDAGGKYPVHGAVLSSGTDGDWASSGWTERGQHWEVEKGPLDLVEVKTERWMWQFDCGMFGPVGHGTQERCESWYKNRRGKAVRFVQEDEA
jgi:hypothetical protein